MTEQEIDAMEAGREMDALVHRHVFSFKAPPYTAWHYSTDIGAAWLVVEKMRELNLSGHLHEALDFGAVWRWLDFSASELSLLICRASLKVSANCHKITTPVRANRQRKPAKRNSRKR